MNKYTDMPMAELDEVATKIVAQLEKQVELASLTKTVVFDLVVEATGSARLAGLVWFNIERKRKVAQLGIKLEI